jgi:vesicle-associated membrane protein 7
MPIIHVLISKNTDSVLFEYTEYQGNFATIARIFLQKIKPNTRQTIQYDLYQYHYINQDNITYLCITSNFPEETTFAFLMEVQRQFLEQNSYDDIMKEQSYYFQYFQKNLKNIMDYYNKCPQKTLSGEIIKNLVDAKSIAIENIEKLIDRDQKLNITVQKSDKLYDQSKNINSLANSIKNQKKAEKLRNMRLLIGGGIILIIILFIIIF